MLWGPAGLEPQVYHGRPEGQPCRKNTTQQVTFTSPAWATCSLPNRLWAQPGPLHPMRPCTFCRACSFPFLGFAESPCARGAVDWTVHCTKLNKNLSRIVQEPLEYWMTEWNATSARSRDLKVQVLSFPAVPFTQRGNEKELDKCYLSTRHFNRILQTEKKIINSQHPRNDKWHL